MSPRIFCGKQSSPNQKHEILQSTLFSIIIPTYNVESYIARCLDSCINQTLRDIEIIIIDDCGSDDSIKIAQRYADKDSRIRIIKNPKNLGTFGARLMGIESALGLYIIFLDADDYLALNACEMIYHQALEPKISTHNATQSLENLPDIIHFRPTYKSAKSASLIANTLHKLRYILPTRFSKKSLQNHQIAQNFFLTSYHFPKFTLVDKCYKTTLIKQILPFMEEFISLRLTMAEDMLKFFVITALAHSYVSVDKRLYIYCLNSSSITQNPRARDKKIADLAYIAKALPNIADRLKTYNPLMPQIAQRFCNNLAALIILESRLLDSRASTPSRAQSVKIARRGGGSARIYTSSAHITCRSWAYPSTQDPSIYALYQITLSALLCLVSAVLGTLSYLYSYVCLYYFFRVYQSLESTFSKKNSASGNHSPDCLHFRAVITDKVTPTLKCKQNKQSNTTIPRILEEETQAQSKNAPTLSSRAVCQHGVAIHTESTFQNKDSRNAFFTSAESMDCRSDKSARNDGKTQNLINSAQDSITAQNLNKSIKDSRSFAQNAQNLTTPQAEAKLDSSKSPSDSKILELKSGFFEPRAEIRLGGLSHKRGDEIHDSSPKQATAVQGAAAAGFFRKPRKAKSLLKAVYAAA